MAIITKIVFRRTGNASYGICDQSGTRLAGVYGHSSRSISRPELSPEEAEAVAKWIARTLQRAIEAGDVPGGA